MPFDGITIRALAQELNTDLIETRIDKIHQPEKDEIVFSLRQPRIGNIRLLISANPRWARMHISTEKRPNPTRPPSFCMLLRKYLEGGKIKEVKQIDFERIVHIRIEAIDDFGDWKDKILICEFMGRHSNVILVNPENNIIIDAIKRYGSDVSSYREVLPGKEYITPPTQGKLNLLATGYDEFTAALWNQSQDQALAASLFNVYSGISPYSAREICSAVGLDPGMAVDQCGEFEFSKLYDYLQKLIENIDQGIINPCALYEGHTPVEFAAFKLSTSAPLRTYKEFASINNACDNFYSQKLTILRLDSMKINLTRHMKFFLDKAYKKNFLQEGDLSKAHENEIYKVWGELITAYSHQLSKGDTETILTDFYTGEEITLRLDPRYTPIQNAQKYFKKYNKSRRALQHLHTLMAQNQNEINYLESVMVAIQQADSPLEITEIIDELEKGGYVKGRPASKLPIAKSHPRKFLSSDGLEILVGRNNHQNDILTLKSDRHDLWLHSKDIPGTHVIVRLPGGNRDINEVPDSTIEEAAGLAAYYSKASQSEKVAVDYTFRSNVHKPSGAKPGLVIYDNYWTIMINPHSAIVEKLLAQAALT